VDTYLWVPGRCVRIVALIVKCGDLWSNILLAAMGVALSMIGPGVWSMDARLFGWKRILTSGTAKGSI
jgi:hypothetical protein